MPRTLLSGMTGIDVEALQRLLNYHLAMVCSPPLVVDGIFGPRTCERVIDFQELNRLYPTTMPIQAADGVVRQPLAIDGIVGPNTGRVLLDVRVISQDPKSQFTPNVASVGDGPAPSPPSPPKVLRFVTLQAGSQASVNPWSISPFVLSGQVTWLARNEGKPDFLLAAGGQFSANLGDVNGSWTAQVFGQMGLGNLNLQLGPLDFLNPFVQVMLQQNQGQSPSAGLAVGNQINLSLGKKTINGIEMDTFSLFLNLQEVANVGLDTGQCSAPSTQGLLGLGWSFF